MQGHVLVTCDAGCVSEVKFFFEPDSYERALEEAKEFLDWDQEEFEECCKEDEFYTEDDYLEYLCSDELTFAIEEIPDRESA